ncbi:hypothetical protein [Burkholderia alba]|uniref:hypothetical protein n=1 Tax=Burkholderia alba TaxID=2683677 RepID=UPI002B05E6B8|nr:hypothetical protein [Burkholderia alba]
MDDNKLNQLLALLEKYRSGLISQEAQILRLHMQISHTQHAMQGFISALPEDQQTTIVAQIRARFEVARDQLLGTSIDDALIDDMLDEAIRRILPGQ